MNLFSSNYKSVALQLTAEVEMLKNELNLERARRISAEAVSEERRLRAEHSEEYARQANEARDRATDARAESLNLVNTTLLRAMQPEAAPSRDILKNYQPIPKDRTQAVPMRRRAEQLFIRQVLDKTQKPKTPSVAEQMESLGADKLAG